MLRYVLRKDGEYYVRGWLTWSRFDIRAITFLTIEDAEKAKAQLHDSDKIIIEKKEETE